MSQLIRISSIAEKDKQTKLNNVLESLDSFIDNSTNDYTQQEYGVLSYTGTITKGQTIYGNKPAKKSNTPVIYKNTYLGKIADNGSLKIVNDTCSLFTYTANYIVGSCNLATSVFNCDLGACNAYKTSETTTCSTSQETINGVKYDKLETCWTNYCCYKQVCVINNPFPGAASWETSQWFTNRGISPYCYCILFPVCDNNHIGYVYCNGKYYYEYDLCFLHAYLATSTSQSYTCCFDRITCRVEVNGTWNSANKKIDLILPTSYSFFNINRSGAATSSFPNKVSFTTIDVDCYNRTCCICPAWGVDYSTDMLTKWTTQITNVNINVRYY